MGLTSELLTEMAVHSGLDLAGAIEAKTLVHLRERLELRRRQGRTTNFEETEIERRIDPTLIWPEARSIIAVGSSYLLTPEKQIASSTEPRGKVARCAQGLDYHLRLEYYARNLVNSMKKELPAPLHFRILIDRNPLVERELAV
ncbi:MAG TPA: DUF1730 domain-containing protein, partial [Firmicutes bacterium]|nr:DUF1730 domain-containing protein [Bacillota bacterium]